MPGEELVEEPDTPDWLVVYGSLMRDLPAANGERETDLLDRLGVGAGLRRVGSCRIGGLLFDLGAYPAFRRSPRDAGSPPKLQRQSKPCYPLQKPSKRPTPKP